MLFNSSAFALFLPLVFLLHWGAGAGSKTRQNAVLLLASYFFYAYWDWRFVGLLLFSTLLDYASGLQIQRAARPATRRWWLYASLGLNLGLLGVFKYYNFFAKSFAAAFLPAGGPGWLLDVVLPIGISFYTFHGLSYVLDVYHQRIRAEKNLVDYALFVSFFPLLVAGPIERATHLLPQVKQPRPFSYAQATAGLRQLLWGLFKKIVVADTCAAYADAIFNHSAQYAGSPLLLGAVFFAFQIYGDFSGYSDIALGTAKLFNIELIQNFAFPYFSRDIAEFWRRWHISLSSWFRDYLYVPLGGSRGGRGATIRNTLVVFLVSGLWHGANWTFVAWGALHALLFLPGLLTRPRPAHLGPVAPHRLLPSGRELGQMLGTFGLVTLAWIFFRAATLPQALDYTAGLFKNPASYLLPAVYWRYKTALLAIAVLVGVEWAGRTEAFALARLGLAWPRPARWLAYLVLAVTTLLFSGVSQSFIYFQF